MSLPRRLSGIADGLRSARARLAAGGHPRAVIAAVVALACVFWSVAGAGAWLSYQVLDSVPHGETLRGVTRMARASVFYDRKGRPAFTIFKEQRIEVPLDRISPHLRQAILAIEDQRFYDHAGVDLIRIAGATLVNLQERRAAQGASTITQQLARMSFFTQEKTLTRKLQEIVAAASIESEYPKDRILELYLNKAYFGAGLYGAEAAALGYFGKPASDLTVAEAALIAGLVKAPSRYAPTANLDQAIKRRAVVLHAMLDIGAIDRATLNDAQAAPVTLVDALRREEPYGRFFKEHVRRELVERFGPERVYEGGLAVHTTIDLDMQRAADRETERALAVLDKQTRRREGSDAALQAALIAMDPRTGEVRALIGGRDFVKSNYNRATLARRQPGSAFKPFLFAAAIDAGFTPATLIERLDDPVQLADGVWIPADDHGEATSMTMRTALTKSSNRAAVRLIQDVGIQKTVSYAERVGMGELPTVPSLALGSGEVTLEALTAAYGVFANRGVRKPPVYITRVEDGAGQVLYAAPATETRVLSERTAFLMSSMLADVVNRGTGWRARQLGFRLPAAGKTGTTNDYHDAWFVGYTPRLVTGVWIGYDQPQPITRRGYAAEVAVPLWAGFMRSATHGDPSAWFAPPRGIVTASICRLSGKLAADGCHGSPAEGGEAAGSTVYTEYFVSGTVPDDSCPIHGRRTIFSRVASWLTGEPPAAASQHRTGAARPSSDSVEAADLRRGTPGPSEAKPADGDPPKRRGFWSRVFGVGRPKDR